MALTKIKTSGIADNAITNAKMADDAIDSADFADGSIDNVHLAGSIAVSKTLLAGGTGLTLSTNTLAVDAAQTQITSLGTLTALTGGTGDLNWDSGTLFVDSSTDAIGIGTTSPNSLFPLHIHRGNAGTDPSWETTEARNLALFETDNNEAAVTIFAPASAVNLYYAFADPSSRVAGYVKYNHNSDTLSLGAAADDRVFITSGGVELNSDSTRFKVGASDDCQFYHNGTDSYLQGTNGHLYLHNNAANKDIKILQEGAGGGVKISTNNTVALDIASDQSSTFAGNVTISSANNPSLYITSSEANTDNFRIYIGGTGLSFYNTTDNKSFHFKHDGDLSFGLDGATVNTKTWGNAEVTGTITSQNPKFMVSNAPKPASSPNPVIYATEKFDVGGGYSTSTGYYTAPKAGHYFFSWWVNHTRRLDLHLSYRSSSSGSWSNVALSQNNTNPEDLGWVTAGRSALWYMAEGAQVRILCDSIDNGATTGWDTGEWNGFSGFMIP